MDIMSSERDDLAYGASGSQGTDRGLVGDTFKFLKNKYQQSQHQSQTQPSFGYTEQPSSQGGQQYTPDHAGYVRSSQLRDHRSSEADNAIRIPASAVNLPTLEGHPPNSRSRDQTQSPRSLIPCTASSMAWGQDWQGNLAPTTFRRHPLTRKAKVVSRAHKPVTRCLEDQRAGTEALLARKMGTT